MAKMSNGKGFSKEELIQYVQSVIDEVYAGSQVKFAREKGISPAYLNDILHNRREPGPKILDAIGVESVVVYRFKKS